MQCFLNKIFLSVLIFLFFSCSKSTSPSKEEPLQKTYSPQEVLTSPNPSALYFRTFKAFRFSSHSELNFPDETPSFQGAVQFEKDQNGNFHLIRKPLSDPKTSEIFLVGGRFYLRLEPNRPFRFVRAEREFHHWQNVIFQEIFSFYTKQKFLSSSDKFQKGSRICWKKENGSLCMDKSSGLPMEGTFSMITNEGASLKMEFSVTEEKKDFSIHPPQS